MYWCTYRKIHENFIPRKLHIEANFTTFYSLMPYGNIGHSFKAISSYQEYIILYLCTLVAILTFSGVHVLFRIL